MTPTALAAAAFATTLPCVLLWASDARQKIGSGTSTTAQTAEDGI